MQFDRLDTAKKSKFGGRVACESDKNQLCARNAQNAQKTRLEFRKTRKMRAVAHTFAGFIQKGKFSGSSSR